MTTYYYSRSLYSVHYYVSSDYLPLQVVELIWCPPQCALALSVANSLVLVDCRVIIAVFIIFMTLCFLYLDYTNVLKLHVHYLEHITIESGFQYSLYTKLSKLDCRHQIG